MPHEPHYVRFTRALAIAASLAACGGTADEDTGGSKEQAHASADASSRRGEPVDDDASTQDAEPEPPYDAGVASGPLCPPELPAAFA